MADLRQQIAAAAEQVAVVAELQSREDKRLAVEAEQVAEVADLRQQMAKDVSTHASHAESARIAREEYAGAKQQIDKLKQELLEARTECHGLKYAEARRRVEGAAAARARQATPPPKALASSSGDDGRAKGAGRSKKSKGSKKFVVAGPTGAGVHPTEPIIGSTLLVQ